MSVLLTVCWGTSPSVPCSAPRPDPLLKQGYIWHVLLAMFDFANVVIVSSRCFILNFLANFTQENVCLKNARARCGHNKLGRVGKKIQQKESGNDGDSICGVGPGQQHVPCKKGQRGVGGIFHPLNVWRALHRTAVQMLQDEVKRARTRIEQQGVRSFDPECWWTWVCT